MSNKYSQFQNEGEYEAPPPYESATGPSTYQQQPPAGYTQAPAGYQPQVPAGYHQPPAPVGYQQQYPAGYHQQQLPTGVNNQSQQPGQPYNSPPYQQPTGYAGPQPVTQQNVVVIRRGNCPNCRIGTLRDSFNVCGIVLAIIFFPLGLLFLLCMIDKKCDNCGYIC